MRRPKPFLNDIIVEPEDFQPPPGTRIVGAFNPGVTTIDELGIEKTLFMIRIAVTALEEPEGKILLPYARVENKDDSLFYIDFDEEDRKTLHDIGKKEIKLTNGLTRLRHFSYPIKALSTDGISIEWKEDNPSFYPCYEHERFGIEDIRIVQIDDEYLLTYVSPHRILGVSTSFATTKNFRKFKRLPRGNTPRPIFIGEKDVVPFPEKLQSTCFRNELNQPVMHYGTLKRPNSFPDFSSPGIWISYSPDLVHWGNDHRITVTEGKRITGTGTPVVKSDDMWIGVYHEVDESGMYRGRLFALDLEEPWKLLHISPVLFEPGEHDREPGYRPGVVYPSGLVIRDSAAYIYSGEDDTYTSVRGYDLKDLKRFLKE